MFSDFNPVVAEYPKRSIVKYFLVLIVNATRLI